MESMRESTPSGILEIRQNALLGRFLVTTRDISVGEVLINEPPLIRGPSQVTGPVCLSCLRSIDQQNSSECVKCGWPLCKDELCHVDDRHNIECDWTVYTRKEKVKIRQFITPHRTYECITPLRCLYQQHKNPEIWQKLMKLESHCDKRQGSQKYIAQFVHRFFKISPEVLTENVISKVCGIIEVNGHEVPLTKPPHVAIYELASMLEHSCIPNCCKTFSNDGNLIIRATQPIKKGENISICYSDPLWSTINRMEHLILTKYFRCECRRCRDPTELGTHYSALNCFNKDCDGYLVPHLDQKKKNPENLPNLTWKCTICNTVQPTIKINNMLSRVGQDYSMTDKQNTTSCEMFLNHYNKNKLLHPNHYFLSNMRLKLAQLYGQTMENDIQALSDAELSQKIKLCQQALEFAAVLYPAEWRIQGVLKFELHASVAEDSRRKMINGDIDPDNLKLKLLESKRWLKETIFYLQYEPEVLPEGKIVKQAKKNLIDLESLLMKKYFQI